MPLTGHGTTQANIGNIRSAIIVVYWDRNNQDDLNTYKIFYVLGNVISVLHEAGTDRIISITRDSNKDIIISISGSNTGFIYRLYMI